jgi:hypothetical protein
MFRVYGREKIEYNRILKKQKKRIGILRSKKELRNVNSLVAELTNLSRPGLIGLNLKLARIDVAHLTN